MSSSSQSQNSFSPSAIKYSNIIATLSLILWAIVWTNLTCLNDRMRTLELDMVQLKTIHGIETGKLPNNGLSQSLSGQGVHLIPPGLAATP
jgi:hypothetical protein